MFIVEHLENTGEKTTKMKEIEDLSVMSLFGDSHNFISDISNP